MELCCITGYCQNPIVVEYGRNGILYISGNRTLFLFMKYSKNSILYRMAGTEFRLPCNLLIRYVVLGIVQRFIKKFGNDCNLGLKAVVIEEQDTNKIFKTIKI